MEIYQLRTFVTVAQQGHLTHAAELLHLSQPAVTAQIKALEEEVGMPLFERSASGVTLTRMGQDLLPQAQNILAATRHMLNHARHLKGQLSAKVKIGVPFNPATLKLGPWIASLVEQHPLLDIQLNSGATVEVLNLIRKKELDAGFYLGENPYSNVATVTLTELPLCVVLPNAWAERFHQEGIKALGKMPWVGISQFSSLSKITSELWRETNIAPKKIVQSDDLAVVLELVASGVGVALVREEDAQAWAAQARLTVLEDVRKLAKLQFAYPADSAGDPVLEVLLQSLLQVWQDT